LYPNFGIHFAFWVQNSTKTLQNGQSRHQIGDCLKIVIFFKCKKLLNVHNYHMYLRFKFHVNPTYDAKVMNQKPSIQGQGDKK